MKKFFVRMTVLCLLALVSGCSENKETQKFVNPVLYSDVPDVDAIRVGEDYFMVSTTMHMMPGAPIMHSKDLVNWEIVSYLYDTIDESPANNLEGGAIYGKGQWASSIRYHEGTFYVFWGSGNYSYLYTTKDPFGKWEMKAKMDRYYHDPSMLFDDNGKVYLAYGAGHVRIVEFYDDLSGINHDGLDVEVVDGDPKGLLEGVHFYKFDNTYYMTFIWWPRGGIRTQLCFRSDKIEGPYEMKQILSDDMDFSNHGVAQGCFIDTQDGAWYAMLFQDHEAVGRVPVLMPLTWQEGWPMLGDENGKVPVVMEVPVKGVEPNKGKLVVSDDFNETKLGLTWQWNHNPDNALWSLTERPGYMRLKTGKVVNTIFEARNTLTQRTEGEKCSGAITIDLKNMAEGDCAGLAAFCAQEGTLTISKNAEGKTLAMTDKGNVIEQIPLKEDVVSLRIDFDFTCDEATFYYSLDGKEWAKLGNPLKMVYNLVHFMGYRFGIFNYATKQAGGYVDVDNFVYSRQEKQIPIE